MIYLFDNKKKLTSMIRKSHIISFLYERERNGLYTISAEVPVSVNDKRTIFKYYDKVNKASYLGHYDKKGRFQLHRISAFEVQDNSILIKGVHLFFDEAKAGAIIQDKRFVDKQALDGVREAFTPIGWNITGVSTSPYRTFNFYNVSPLEARQILIDTFGFEFDYWFDFDGKKITNKYVTFKKSIGIKTNKRYQYGHNVLNIKAEQDYSEIYTAVIGRGKGEEITESGGYGRRIEFTDVLWTTPNNPMNKPVGQRMLVDDNATNLFGYHDNGVTKPRIKVVIFEDIENPIVLLEESYRWLMQNNVPKAVFGVNVIDGEGLDLGDEVYVLYKDIDLVKSTRVSKVIDNLLNDQRDVEFGDSEYFNTDRRIEKVSNEISRVESDTKTAQGETLSALEKAKADFNARFDNEVSAMFTEYDKALADAKQSVLDMDARITKQIEEGRLRLLDDINIAKGQAIDSADAKYTSLQNEFNVKIDNNKTTLIDDINKAVTDSKAYADTQYNALKTEVSNSISNETTKIQQNIDSAVNVAKVNTDAQISALSSDLNNKLYTNKTAQDSAIANLNANISAIDTQLQSKASADTFNTFQTSINNTIDSIKASGYGSPNLIKESLTISPTKLSSTTVTSVNHATLGANTYKTTMTDGTAFAQNFYYYYVLNLSQLTKAIDPNKQYTFSINLLANANTSVRINFSGVNSSTVSLKAGVPFRLSMQISGAVLSSKTQHIIYLYILTTGVTEMYTQKAKLEEGTLATDWTPSLEDANQSVTSVNQQIDELKQQISSKVEITTFNTLNSSVSTIGSQVTQNKNAIQSAVYNINNNKTNISNVKMSVDSITSKVATIEGGQLTQGTQIQQNTNEIQSMATTVNGNTQSISSLSQKADGIQASVTSLNDWKAQAGSNFELLQDKIQASVWQKVDAQNIGTVNLLSNAGVSITNASNVINTYSKNGTISYKQAGAYPSLGLNIGKLQLNTSYWIRVKFKVTAGTLQNVGITGSNYNAGVDAIYFDKVKVGSNLGIFNFVHDNLTHTIDIHMKPTTTAPAPTDKISVTLNYNKYDATTPLQATFSEISLVQGDKPLLNWTSAQEDILRHTDVVLTNNGFSIGTTTVDGTKMATAIVGSPTGLSLIGNNVDVSNNLTVQNLITAKALNVIDANIGRIRTGVLSAGSITSDMLQSDIVLANHIKVDEALVNKLMANFIFAKAIETESFKAIEASIGNLSASILTAGVITTEMLQSNVITADKLRVDEALINKLVTNNIFTDTITSKTISAIDGNIGKLTTAVLDSIVITTDMLDAEVVTADKIKVDQALFDKLIAGTVLADEITAKTMEVVRMNAGEITTLILESEIINATHIKVDNALIDKMFADEALISRLTTKEAFIRDVKAIEITADKINGGVLSSLNDAMEWNLNTGNFRSNFAKFIFEQPSSALVFEKDGTVAGVHFSIDGTSAMPVAVIGSAPNVGTTEDPYLDSNSPDFAGIRAFNNGSNSNLELVGDSISIRNEAGAGTSEGRTFIFDMNDSSNLSFRPYSDTDTIQYSIGTDTLPFDDLYVQNINGITSDEFVTKEFLTSEMDSTLSSYALQSDLDSLALKDDLSNYVKTSDLSSYTKTSDLTSYAKITDLSAYAKTTSLTNYALKTDLSTYAKTTDLSSYAKVNELTNYVTKDELVEDVNTVKVTTDKIIQNKSNSLLIGKSSESAIEIRSSDVGSTYLLPYINGPAQVFLGLPTNRFASLSTEKIEGFTVFRTSDLRTTRIGNRFGSGIEIKDEVMYLKYTEGSTTKSISFKDLFTKLGVV